jgi:DNA-binding transcriptional LysR family regulator
MHSENWDDLRFVLAVAESGSVSAAARALGVNHATVLRRIAAFEDHHNAVIFDRTQQGYTVPPDKLRIVEAAREAAVAIDTVARMIRGNGARLTGTVRITSTDTFCTAILPPILAQVQSGSDGLRVELLCNNAHLDLARLNADISVRPAPKLPDDLRGEVAANLGFAAYAALNDAAPTWLGLRGTLTRSPAALWIEKNLSPDIIAGGSDSFVVLREMVADHMGRSILPCCLGDTDPRLIRLPDVPHMSVPIWIASHADLADAPRLRSLRLQLALALRQRAPLLAGDLIR